MRRALTADLCSLRRCIYLGKPFDMPGGWQALPTGTWMMLDEVSLLWYLRDMNLCPKLGELQDNQHRAQFGREWVTIDEVARFRLITRIVRAHIGYGTNEEGQEQEERWLPWDRWFTSRFA